MREALETAIAGLTTLLSKEKSTESQYQAWFEANPVVFDVLGYQRSISQPKLVLEGAATFIPDFLAQRPDGLWEIVELKLPDVAVLKNPDRRTTFYSDMNSYVAQCLEYSERCSDSQVAQALYKSCDITINSHPDSILIAGRSKGLDRLQVHNLVKRSTPKIKHFTYDDVLDALHQRYASVLSGNTEGPGLSYYTSIYLLPMEGELEECLLDIGNSRTNNRITLSRYQDKRITFAVVDAAGLRSSQDVDITNHCDGRDFIWGVHVTQNPSMTLVLLEINGSYVGEHKLARGSLTLEHPLAYVVGANLEGKQCATMVMGTHLLRDPALNILERTQVREYMFEKLLMHHEENGHQPAGMRFQNGQFMYSEGHPYLDPLFSRTTNLVQRVNDRRPIVTAWPTSN